MGERALAVGLYTGFGEHHIRLKSSIANRYLVVVRKP